LIVRNVAVRLVSTAARQSSSLHFLERGGSGRAAAGVRDQDVDRAAEVFDLFSHRFDLLVAGEVGDERHDLSARCLDLAPDGRDGVAVAAVHDDARAFVCEE
jgi:hypothetical protein